MSNLNNSGLSAAPCGTPFATHSSLRHTRAMFANRALLHILPPHFACSDACTCVCKLKLDGKRAWDRHEDCQRKRSVARDSRPRTKHISTWVRVKTALLDNHLPSDPHPPKHIRTSIVAFKHFISSWPHNGVAMPGWVQESG